MVLNSDSALFERHFGHSFITWKIHKICFETINKDFSISSQEFCVDGLHLTKWKITLKVELKRNGEYCLYNEFERTESDTAPTYACVDLKFWILGGKLPECGLSYNGKFSRKNPHKIHLWSVNYVQEVLKSSACKSGVLALGCHMIVNFENVYVSNDGHVDKELKVLSEDFTNLFRVGSNHDVILRINTNDIYAHKAILFPRSAVLAEIIKKECKGMVVNLPHFDYVALQSILAYLYSGNIDYIIKNPSLVIYEYATFLDLPDVKQLYSLQSLEIQTTINLQEHVFSWAVNLKQFNGDCIESPPFIMDYMDTIWKISIYSKSMKYLSVFADVIQGTIPKCGYVEFALVEGNEKHWSKELQMAAEDNRLGFEKFLTTKTLDFLLNDVEGDDINVSFKIKFPSDTVSSSEKYTISHSALLIHRYYTSFSLHLLYIFEKSLFTDIIIEAEGESFHVHKCVLSARSKVFDLLLKEINGNKLVVLNTKPNVLRIILSYIYSGVYANFKLEDIVDVYRAADQFSLRTLKERCSNILQENFNSQSVCDALVLADEQSDLDFINDNNIVKAVTGKKLAILN